jgi:PAS domain S-box-containing protein
VKVTPSVRIIRWQHSQLLIGLLMVCFLGMAAAMAWYYARQRAAVEAAAIQELTSVSDIEAAQIQNWRQERLGDGSLIMALSEIKAAERLVGSLSGPGDRVQLVHLMAALNRAYGYNDVTLVGKEGETYIRLKDGTAESRLTKSQRSKLARQTSEPTLSDIGMDRTGARLITLTVPVSTVGALILEIDPKRFLDPYLKSWRSSNRTGETYLARREPGEIVYLTQLRHGNGSAVWRPPTTGLSLPDEDKLPEYWVSRGRDYRGVEVVLRARHIADSPWFLLVKKDLVEINEPLARLAWEMTAALGLIAFALTAGAGWIWKSHQVRIRHESEDRLRSFANHTPALLWVVSADGNSIFLNQVLSSFLGADKQPANEHWQQYLHPDDYARVGAQIKDCFDKKNYFSGEARIRRADGVYRWVLGQGVPRIAANGEFAGYAGALLDITDRKENEQRLQQLYDTIRALSARLINAQEDERRRLSRELHDDLSQQIAALSVGLGNLKRGLPSEQTEARAHCDKIQHRLIDISELVRRISHELHPSILQHSGVAAALRGYCREFEGLSGIRVALQITGDFSGLHQDVALTIFRIVQEALRNIAKHARVSEAEIQLTRSQSEVCLVVADHGAGMPANRLAKAGLGQVSMRERTSLVNGTMDIESAPGQGTRLTVRIPDEPCQPGVRTTGPSST